MIKELFRDVVKYLPSYVVPAVVGVVAIPVITRLFSPEEYGNYILVMTTVSVLSALSSAWLSSAIIRFLPAYKLANQVGELRTTIVKLAITSIMVTSIIFAGILLLLVKSRISPELYFLMRIGALVLIVTSCSQIFLAFLRAERRVMLYSSFIVWQSVTKLGIGMVMVLIFGYGVDGLLWGVVLALGATLPLMWKFTIGKLSLKEGRLRSRMSREMAKYGFPVVAVNLATWVLSFSDRYMLGIFRGSQEVGIYSASYTISEHTIFMIASVFMVASAPIGFRIWETQGSQASQNFINRLSRYYILIGLPITVGLSALARSVVGILTAQAYSSGYKIVPVVAFGAFLVGITHRFSEVLTFYKRTDILMYCMIGAALLNIGLNFIFIPKYGYMAAAATTLIAYGADLTGRIVLSRRFFVWKFPFKSLGKAAVASAVMGVVVYPVGNSLTSSTLANLVLGVVVGMLVYAVMILLLREPQKEEIQGLLTILLRRKR